MSAGEAMKKLGVFRASIAVLVLLGISGTARNTQALVTIYPVNDGFEVPDQGSGGGAYSYNTGGATWSLVGGAGLAANGSAFGVSGASNGNANGGATSTSGQ